MISTAPTECPKHHVPLYEGGDSKPPVYRCAACVAEQKRTSVRPAPKPAFASVFEEELARRLVEVVAQQALDKIDEPDVLVEDVEEEGRALELGAAVRAAEEEACKATPDTSSPPTPSAPTRKPASRLSSLISKGGKGSGKGKKKSPPKKRG